MNIGDAARVVLVGLTLVSLIVGFVWAIIKLIFKKLKEDAEVRLSYENQFAKLDKTLAELTLLQKSQSERLLKVEQGLNKLTDVIIEQKGLIDKVDALINDVAEIKIELSKKVDREEWVNVCESRHSSK